MAREIVLVFKDPAACTARLIATWRMPPSTAKTGYVVVRCVSRVQKSYSVCMRTPPCMRTSVKRAITLAHVTHARVRSGEGVHDERLGKCALVLLPGVISSFTPRPISLPPPALPAILPPSLPDSVPQSLRLTSLHPSLLPFPILSLMQGCKNRASFGGHRAEWCSLHRAPHDTNKRLSSCTFAGCLKQASFLEHIHLYACMRVCMSVLDVCMFCMYLCLYACMYTCMHVYMYVNHEENYTVNCKSQLLFVTIIIH